MCYCLYVCQELYRQKKVFGPKRRKEMKLCTQLGINLCHGPHLLDQRPVVLDSMPAPTSLFILCWNNDNGLICVTNGDFKSMCLSVNAM